MTFEQPRIAPTQPKEPSGAEEAEPALSPLGESAEETHERAVEAREVLRGLIEGYTPKEEGEK